MKTLIRHRKDHREGWAPAFTDAVVLSGGGSLGSAQVGMLRALFEAGITPDLYVGASVGALNATFMAIDPTARRVDELETLWRSLVRGDVFGGTRRSQLGHLLRHHPNVYEPDALERLIRRGTGELTNLADAAAHVEIVTTDMNIGKPAWFSTGDPVAILAASCCLPGAFPPVRIGGHLHIDGGVLVPVPTQRALDLGAGRVWVLDVSAGLLEEGSVHEKMSSIEVLFASFAVARAACQRELITTDPSQALHHVTIKSRCDIRDFGRTDELIAAGHAAATTAIAAAVANEAAMAAVATARRKLGRFGDARAARISWHTPTSRRLTTSSTPDVETKEYVGARWPWPGPGGRHGGVVTSVAS